MREILPQTELKYLLSKYDELDRLVEKITTETNIKYQKTKKFDFHPFFGGDFMGMEIEVVAKTWYTVHLSDEDVQKVKQWIKNHENDLPSFDMKENISEAVHELYANGEISFYDDEKFIESDFNTEDVRWSEFEEREPEEILED